MDVFLHNTLNVRLSLVNFTDLLFICIGLRGAGIIIYDKVIMRNK